MKKLISVTAVLLLTVCSLCSCSGGKENTDTTVPEATDSVQVSQNEKAGYAFTKDSVSVHIGDNAADVIAALGEAKDKFTSESCAFGGEDTVYYYDGFQISSNNETGAEIIFSVYLEDGTVKTEEGIAVGNAAEEVKTAYGEGGEGSTENSLVYTKDGIKLVFTLENGVVSSVLYSAAD